MPAALLGALASLNELSRDNPKWGEWARKGEEMLTAKQNTPEE